MLVLVGLFGVSSVFATSLEECANTDAKCVGKVILDRLAGTNNSTEVVEFYKDDGRCESDKLLAKIPMKDLERCEKLAPFIKERVWGIRLYGSCIDLQPDEDFSAACQKFVR